MNRPLTEKQQRVYAVIRAGILNKGCAPAVREIGREIGGRNSCTVQRHLEALERKGFIRRSRRYAYRAWELTDQTAVAGDVRRALVRLAAACSAAKMGSLPAAVETALEELLNTGFDPDAAAAAEQETA